MTETPLVADPSQQLKNRVAARVRSQRKAQGLPRRVLSEMSDVSPRYLAQLEAGEGNISIALLHRIALALGLPVDSLLSEDAPQDREAQRIGELYREASPDVQRAVRGLLAPQNPAALRAGRICLIGLRGAGKSTLGKLASEALNLPFVELNREIERETGMPLAEVMAFYGQEGYRALEADAISRVVATHDRLVLAVAGGLVAEEATYEQVLQRFHTVWLKTSPVEHMQRVRAQGDLRPMQGNPAAMEQLKSLLDARAPLYRRADAQVDTSSKTVKSSLNDLLKVIASKGFLDGAAE
ncbi:helix-turn-helix transcriptional regulator [uncultured Roseobacter sp.]|uniref:helix-turn-helix transcriptional regulator n=1 Tax=uncultured Roseobacter sp. TaxID=114847 RepID=UPI002613C3D2|nr:helix-turn-helix transcriptional regulator [uncultured Roseobacter sp.]